MAMGAPVAMAAVPVGETAFPGFALMLTLARTGRIDKLSGGKCRSDDFVAVKQRMATFMANGLKSICKIP